jgi:hypothetical protein
LWLAFERKEEAKPEEGILEQEAEFHLSVRPRMCALNQRDDDKVHYPQQCEGLLMRQIDRKLVTSTVLLQHFDTVQGNVVVAVDEVLEIVTPRQVVPQTLESASSREGRPTQVPLYSTSMRKRRKVSIHSHDLRHLFYKQMYSQVVNQPSVVRHSPHHYSSNRHYHLLHILTMHRGAK